jgi:hypothetical protein
MPIDINEVRKLDVKRKEIRKEIYTRIYEQFERKIRQQVELGRDKYVFLRVPSYVMGYPKFDREAAARYLVRQFARSGFDAQHVGEVDVFVSWRPKVKTKKSRPAAAGAASVEVELPVEFPTLMNLKKAASAYKTG